MNCIVIDTETTGVEPGSRIIEAAAIAIDGYSAVIERAEWLAYPGMPLPPDVSEIHGLTAAEVATFPHTSKLLDGLSGFCERYPGAPIVAHYAQFDVGMIQYAYDLVGEYNPFADRQVICTCESAKLAGKTKRNRLIDLVEHYGIERIGDAHRAMSDADACAQYFMRHVTHTSALPWTERIEYRFTPEMPAGFDLLPEAVLYGGTLAFSYTERNGALTERSITPYGWSLKGGTFMFHGLCHLRGERRTFVADSCRDVRIDTAPRKAVEA